MSRLQDVNHWLALELMFLPCRTTSLFRSHFKLRMRFLVYASLMPDEGGIGDGNECGASTTLNY